MKKILIIGFIMMSVVSYAVESDGTVTNYDPAAGSGGYTGSVTTAPGWEGETPPANQSGTNMGNANQSGTNMGNANQNPSSVYDPKEVAPSKNNFFNNNSTYDKNLNKNLFNDAQKEKGVPKLSLSGIVAWLMGLIGQLIYLIIALALVSFLYGILKLSFIDGQKPEAREQARKFMFWGIVSLFVMVSVWGIVQIFQFTLFGNGPLLVPEFKK